MPINLEDRSNGSNRNGKGFAPQPKQQEIPKPSTAGTDRIDEMGQTARQAIGNLKQADLHNAASALDRLQMQWQSEVDSLSESFAFYLDPDSKVNAAILVAAQKVSNKGRRESVIPFGSAAHTLPELPSVPSFSDWLSPTQSPQLKAAEDSQSQQ